MPDSLPLQLNLVLLTGRIVRRTDLSLTSFGVPVITLILENPQAAPASSADGGEAHGELSVELWGHMAREYDERLKPGEPVLIEAQVSGRQKQDRTTKLVHHWMVLKARRIQILTNPFQNGGS